ncbi:MAG TPA: hypothetical protein VG734_19480, partial [Lacunisphaera sp.]|nr:hypothetical protein [Lacunisphaera sp.]
MPSEVERPAPQGAYFAAGILSALGSRLGWLEALSSSNGQRAPPFGATDPILKMDPNSQETAALSP